MNLVEHNTSGVGLRGNVSKEEALRLFANAGLAGALRRARIGRLQRVAAAYVPFEIYRVSYEMGKRRQTRLFAQDQVEGLLDLFEFPELPGGEEFVSIENKNCLPVGLRGGAGGIFVKGESAAAVVSERIFQGACAAGEC